MTDPAAAARAALFADDFHIDDPREPSPTEAEPLLRQAIETDPGDVTSTLLLASVLSRQLTSLYLEPEPYGQAWAEEIFAEDESPDADLDPDEYVEQLWRDAIVNREAEIGRLLAPLSGDTAAAAVLSAVDCAEEWRRDAEPEFDVAAELRAADVRLPRSAMMSASRFHWYELDFATMCNNNGDVVRNTWLATDVALLRRALDRVLDRRRSNRVWHDVEGESLTLSCFADGVLNRTIDMRPQLILTGDTPRMDWEAVHIPELAGTPLPPGHPIEGSQPYVGAVHYGFNPGLV